METAFPTAFFASAKTCPGQTKDELTKKSVFQEIQLFTLKDRFS